MSDYAAETDASCECLFLGEHRVSARRCVVHGASATTAVSPWHAERGCVPGGFCHVWGRRHPRLISARYDREDRR